jgi:hypothetical protein
MSLQNYVNNFKNFKNTIVYDYKLGCGGLGDYFKFFMIILQKCINNNIRFHCKINNIEIEKYIKVKYIIFYINSYEIKKLKNYTIKVPGDYYNEDSINFNMALSEIFYFDNIIKMNVKNILSSLPKNYISIHLRMGDKFLETDKNFVVCKEDRRNYSEEAIYNFIENNNNKNIIFFCDNNNFKLKINSRYKNVIITNAKIGHISLFNTTNKQVLDTITDFYILSNSESIYAASVSGFSLMASKFNNIPYIQYTNKK